MGQQTGGWMGNGGQTWGAGSPMDLHITMPANEYPRGTLKMGNFGNSASNCRWTCQGKSGSIFWYTIQLCDEYGGNAYNIGTAKIIGGQNNTGANNFDVNCPNLRGKNLYMRVVCSNTTPYWYGRSTGIEVGTATYSFNITVQQPETGGTISCGTSVALPGTSIEISNTPAQGYSFKKYTFTVDTVMLDENHFYMPSANVTISAEFEKTIYYITPGVNKEGAGIVTVNPGTANMGDTVAVSQTTAPGYYFDGFTTSPPVTITSGEFTMPDSDVTVTANYKKISTASVNKTIIEGGPNGYIRLTIDAESAEYTHKYQLSFGTGMETAVTDMAAGSSLVSFSVPITWCNQIPNQVTKTGGTLTVWTYSGQTMIGSYEITGLTFKVPDSVKPSTHTKQVRPERTIDGTTYPDIGVNYVQGHCGAYIKVTANGQYNSTITSISVTVSGYSGNKYNYTSLSDTLIFTTGLLYVAGETIITHTITDSRGRTKTGTTKINVAAYSAPQGTLEAWRVDSNGDEDDMGTYAKYSLTKQYTQLGNNAITWSVSCTLGSVTDPADTGDLLPNDRKTFSQTQEYAVTLTITDALETFTTVTKIPSAKFAMYVQAGGDKIGIMKVPNQPIPSGKDSTFEISANTQIYIGSVTLEDYIRSLIV